MEPSRQLHQRSRLGREPAHRHHQQLTLNTTTATSIFALNYSTGMVKVGNYLSPTVRFTVTPPAGGSFTTTTQHSTLGQIGSHQSPETTQKSWGWPGSSSTLTSGQILGQHHDHGRLQSTTVDTYTYLIDGEVNATIQYGITSRTKVVNNIRYTPDRWQKFDCLG